MQRILLNLSRSCAIMGTYKVKKEVGVVDLATLETQEEDAFDMLKATAGRYQIPENAPVLPPLVPAMGVEIVVKDDGSTMILHDKPMPEPVHWVDYDLDLDLLTFVSWKGKIFNLGMKVQPNFRKYMRKGQSLYIVYMEGGKTAKSVDTVPLIVRQIGL